MFGHNVWSLCLMVHISGSYSGARPAPPAAVLTPLQHLVPPHLDQVCSRYRTTDQPTDYLRPTSRNRSDGPAGLPCLAGDHCQQLIKWPLLLSLLQLAADHPTLGGAHNPQMGLVTCHYLKVGGGDMSKMITILQFTIKINGSQFAGRIVFPRNPSTGPHAPPYQNCSGISRFQNVKFQLQFLSFTRTRTTLRRSN